MGRRLEEVELQNLDAACEKRKTDVDGLIGPLCYCKWRYKNLRPHVKPVGAGSGLASRLQLKPLECFDVEVGAHVERRQGNLCCYYSQIVLKGYNQGV